MKCYTESAVYARTPLASMAAAKTQELHAAGVAPPAPAPHPPGYIPHIGSGEPAPNLTVMGMTEHCGAGIGGTPPLRRSACEWRDDCPSHTCPSGLQTMST